MEVPGDISWPPLVVLYEVLVARWALVLLVTGKHALQAHAHALDIVNGTPALSVEQVETDETVRVHVWVHRDLRGCGSGDERHFRCFDGLLSY